MLYLSGSQKHLPATLLYLHRKKRADKLGLNKLESSLSTALFKAVEECPTEAQIVGRVKDNQNRHNHHRRFKEMGNSYTVEEDSIHTEAVKKAIATNRKTARNHFIAAIVLQVILFSLIMVVIVFRFTALETDVATLKSQVTEGGNVDLTGMITTVADIQKMPIPSWLEYTYDQDNSIHDFKYGTAFRISVHFAPAQDKKYPNKWDKGMYLVEVNDEPKATIASDEIMEIQDTVDGRYILISFNEDQVNFYVVTAKLEGQTFYGRLAMISVINDSVYESPPYVDLASPGDRIMKYRVDNKDMIYHQEAPEPWFPQQ